MRRGVGAHGGARGINALEAARRAPHPLPTRLTRERPIREPRRRFRLIAPGRAEANTRGINHPCEATRLRPRSRAGRARLLIIYGRTLCRFPSRGTIP